MCATGHTLLLVGPPGAGKSMLAARLPGLLPDLTPSEALEVSMIHSVAGLLEGGRLVRRPPFREPHHGASQAALAGGGCEFYRLPGAYNNYLERPHRNLIDDSAALAHCGDRRCAGSTAIGSMVRVSRTIARLDDSYRILRRHVAEAAWLSPPRPVPHMAG